MQLCTFQTLAIRITKDNLAEIARLNGGVKPELEDAQTYFMLYCFISDHEEAAIIDEDTFLRTYGEMPENLRSMFVTTID